MPKITREVSAGNQFSRSSNQGQLADSAVRAFRIVLNDPTETFDIQQECGVFIGDKHPVNDNLYCVSFDGRLEGDSRMVYSVSFQYQSTADAASSSGGGSGADPKSQPPDVRPPSWTTSTSLIEQPIYTWRKRTGQRVWGNDGPAVNPAGDIYDGVTRMVPIVTISIQSWASTDPTVDNQHAGKVNSVQNTIGTLVMEPHTLMFRGVQCQPAVESWGGSVYRGWRVTYEFMYKKNETKVRVGGVDLLVDLGWDVAIPQSGFNVKVFAPPGNADQDPFGQPLKFTDELVIDDNPLALGDDLNAGDKARAMVRVPLKDKSTQSPSASPIPLNDDGTPRADTADPKVLVYGYAVQPEMNFNLLNNGRPLI